MTIKSAVIGLGYWGPNFVRNFLQHPKTEIKWGCDLSKKLLDKTFKLYPQLHLTSDYKEILEDNETKLVMIATPPASHYKIAKDLLLAGKNVIIAKPFTTNSKDSIELLKIAKKKGLLLHGDLTYLYTGAVNMIKKNLGKEFLGEPLYFDSTRANLGLIQKDVNVIWDLAPHDFAIIDHFFALKPQKIFATASKHYSHSCTDEMAHITVTYEKNFIAHIHVSWLSPVKLRNILIGGTKKMFLYDDVQPDEKVKIYDKGVDIEAEDISYIKPIYRSGRIFIPKLSNEEAIYLEINDITNQIINNKINYKNAHLNIRIIKLLEACDKSIKLGKPIYL